jgi:hypothetical protein
MDPAHQRIRLSYDHARGEDLLTPDPCELPNAGKSEGFKVFASKSIWLFAISTLLPFIKTRRGN